MSTLVLDSSVAVKFAFPISEEPYLYEAVHVFESYKAGETRLIVPDIFWAEIGNVAWKGVRQNRWSRRLAETAIAGLQTQDFPTVPSRDLLREAAIIALDYNRSVYDSLYVALAVASGSILVSADEPLVNALAVHFPVKWLGVMS